MENMSYIYDASGKVNSSPDSKSHQVSHHVFDYDQHVTKLGDKEHDKSVGKNISKGGIGKPNIKLMLIAKAQFASEKLQR